MKSIILALVIALSLAGCSRKHQGPEVQNLVSGKSLQYLIGADGDVSCDGDAVTEAPYGNKVIGDCLKIAYVNLFDEKNTGKYGPYLYTSDTAQQYSEGQISPSGPGWKKNLDDQFKVVKENGFEYIELDNPDAYHVIDVIGAIEYARMNGLKVISKNPGISDYGEDFTPAVANTNVYGIIVEKGAGTPESMDAMRKKAGKPDLPVWFVFFGKNGSRPSKDIAAQATKYKNMSVTYSSFGEYGNSIDVVNK